MIWLVGSNGMFASELKDLFSKKGVDYIASDSEIDISDAGELLKFFNKHSDKKISHIICAAAYNFVDKAEDEKNLAFKVNAEGVKNIAKLAEANNITVIHFSTDYVFDGAKKTPYIETDIPNPLSVYGESKARSEKYLFEYSTKNYLVRTTWLYSKFGNNFVKKVLSLMLDHNSIKIVDDQIGSPTYAKDLANFVFENLLQDKLKYGIYHYSNLGEVSWFEFAKEIKRLAGNYIDDKFVHKDIQPTTTEQFNAKAKRPQYSYLSKDKLVVENGVIVRQWQDALNELFQKFGQEIYQEICKSKK